MVGGRSMKDHREVLEALLAGETLISFLGETARLVDDMVVSDSTFGKLFIPVIWEIKKKTININGYEVPEPVREPLQDGTRYYYITTLDVNTSTWSSDSIDLFLLQKGIIHLTEKAAELHLKALLSFTESR